VCSFYFLSGSFLECGLIIILDSKSSEWIWHTLTNNIK
jgi:hypothetical protein